MPRHDVPRRRPNKRRHRSRACSGGPARRTVEVALAAVVAMRRAYHDWSLRYLVKVDTVASNSSR